MTQVIKIDLLQVDDADKAIEDACTVRESANPPLKLAAVFESGGELVLIFQS